MYAYDAPRTKSLLHRSSSSSRWSAAGQWLQMNVTWCWANNIVAVEVFQHFLSARRSAFDRINGEDEMPRSRRRWFIWNSNGNRDGNHIRRPPDRCFCFIVILHSDDYLRPPPSTSIVQFFSKKNPLSHSDPIHSLLVARFSKYHHCCFTIYLYLRHHRTSNIVFYLLGCRVFFFLHTKKGWTNYSAIIFYYFALASLAWIANSLVGVRLCLANENRSFSFFSRASVRWCREMLCGDMNVWCECECGRHLFRPRLRLMSNRSGWSEIEISLWLVNSLSLSLSRSRPLTAKPKRTRNSFLLCELNEIRHGKSSIYFFTYYFARCEEPGDCLQPVRHIVRKELVDLLYLRVCFFFFDWRLFAVRLPLHTFLHTFSTGFVFELGRYGNVC